MATSAPPDIEVLGETTERQSHVLTEDALRFVSMLHARFNERRLALLEARRERHEALAAGAGAGAGALPDFLPDTRPIRESQWRVADTPPDLLDRRVEITGPVDAKMMINALNSGARVFMADFEDATSPTWSNVMDGQANLFDAVRRTLEFTSADGKEYRLDRRTATLVVRPRGWHLEERHVTVNGEPIAASLFDFGLCFFHNARQLLSLGSGPYFYLPKLESHVEARLWNDVFLASQEALGIPRGTIRATVLIETILAAFEMEEILFELREHSAGLNAGRWDYIFSVIKTLGMHSRFVLPDRAQVTMDVPFMRAYARLLVKTCHRRGAHAIGGMAAFIPSRRDPEVNEQALAKVREDKRREAADGFDGTWVAHPDLVPVAGAIFDGRLGEAPHQRHELRDDVRVTAGELLDVRVPGARVTLPGIRTNVRVALEYLEAWLGGVGAVAIANLMEDTATAEISRAQLWQWVRHGTRLEDGRAMTAELYREVRAGELRALQERSGASSSRLDEAATLLDALVLDERFTEFLTIPGYRALD